MIIFWGLVLIIVEHQIFYWIYLWQLKEYRFDRMMDLFYNRFDWKRLVWDQFELRRFYRPVLTMRAKLSLITAEVLVLAWVGKYFDNFWGILAGVVMAPLLAGLALVIWTPLFLYIKTKKIRQATIKMENFKGTVIGITGSYGKSTTKEILAEVLAAKFKVAKTKANNNSEIGVALRVLELKGDEEIFIVEMGAYKIGEIRSICKIVRPTVGIITGIGDQHLSLFGSLENIKKAKYELIDFLPKDGLGLVADVDFKLEEAINLKEEKDKVTFEFEGEKFEAGFRGKSLVRNALGVIKTAKYLGMSLKEISWALGKINFDDFYPKLIKVSRDKYIIDDSYNSSLESFKSVLSYLDCWQGYSKILVSSGMIELGERAAEDHRIVGNLLGNLDQVWVTNRAYFKELNVGGRARLETNYDKLIIQLRKEFKDKTVILFKGRMPKKIIDLLKNE